MKFYRIDTSDMFMNRKYAYLSVSKKNEVKDKDKEVIHNKYICPFCGYKMDYIFYPARYYGIFNKDNVGDFTFGVTVYGDFGISLKSKELIEKYDLKGVIEFKKYLSIETTRKKPITSIDNNYYEAKITYLPLICHQVVNEDNIPKSYLFERNIGEYGCKKCVSNKEYYSLEKTDKLYVKGLDEVTLDVFTATDNPSEIFISQRFVDMCVKEKLSNITNRLVEIYDTKDYNNI